MEERKSSTGPLPADEHYASNRRSRRDPFSWVLVGMGTVFILAVPSLAIAVAVGSPLGVSVVLFTSAAAMALMASSTLGIAVAKGGARHSLSDLLCLVFVAAIGCAMFIYDDPLVTAGLLFVLISTISIWWTNRRRYESRANYLWHLAGSFLVLTLAATLLMPLIVSTIEMARNGQGR